MKFCSMEWPAADRRVVLRGKEEIGRNISIGKKVSWFSLAVPSATRRSCRVLLKLVQQLMQLNKYFWPAQNQLAHHNFARISTLS